MKMEGGKERKLDERFPPPSEDPPLTLPQPCLHEDLGKQAAKLISSGFYPELKTLGTIDIPLQKAFMYMITWNQGSSYAVTWPQERAIPSRGGQTLGRGAQES